MRLDTAALLGYLFFVVYGSLVPLDFRPLPLADAWARFQAIPFLQLGVESRADWIANGVLYAPLGFLSSWRLLRAGTGALAAVTLAVLLGVLVALGVEFSQLYFPPRTVSLNDVLAECIGTVVGALLALVYRRRSGRDAAALQRAVPWLRAHGLGLYALAYVAFCLFPYDLLVSAAEFEDKFASGMWSWWLADQDGRALVVVLRLAIEVAMSVPLGLLLGQRAAGRVAPGYGRAVLVGLAFGLGIEGAQLLTASGVTQGASVLTRVLGVCAGLALWRQRSRFSVEGVRVVLRRSAWLWLPAYLLLLLAVNGWFAYDWQGLDAALAQWPALRFLPFYYHYYTTEAHALVSLASVLLMYLPVALLAWALRRSAAAAAAWGAGTCLVIETSKLFIVGLRPDPSNLFIAAVGCWGLVQAANALPRLLLEPGARLAADAFRGAAVPELPRTRGATRLPLLLLAALLLVWHGVSAPAFAVASTLLIGACTIAVWHRPLRVMWIVPALLPVLDLTVWSGRFFWGEFDLLLLLCLGAGYLRCPATRSRRSLHAWGLVYAVLVLSLGLSTVIGAMPWPWPDDNSFNSYYSPYNALRIATGVVWAGLFIGLLRRLEGAGHDARAALASGMALGLLYVVAFVIWERVAFVGLFDVAADYRVTGPFSAMHRGGAFIECYIAVALPFVLLRVVDASGWAARIGGAALLLGASYAMMVTFSRNGYAAFAVALSCLLPLMFRAGSRRRAWLGATLGLAMLAVALPVLLGGFAQERLARWQQDLAVRQAHWADALSMRDGDVRTAAFGMGLGRYPETHFWRSREALRAASYRLEGDGESHYLRLAGGGGGLYIDQMLPLSTAGPLTLNLRLRSTRPGEALALSVCDKWMLTSLDCVGVSVQAAAHAGEWVAAQAIFDRATRSDDAAAPWRPSKFALHTPAEGAVVDVTEISLRDADGRELLANGDFRAGLDHWFFSTDIDPPWHIHSLPVAVLFEQGWFGVLAWAVLIATALTQGARRAWRGDRHAAAALAALLAFLVSASLNTLIDEPRFLFVLLLVAGLCCVAPSGENRASKRAYR